MQPHGDYLSNMTDGARLTWLATLSITGMVMNFCLMTGIFRVHLLCFWHGVVKSLNCTKHQFSQLLRLVHLTSSESTSPVEPDAESDRHSTAVPALTTGQCVGLICAGNFLLDVMFVPISLASTAVQFPDPTLICLTKALLSGTRTNSTLCTLWFVAILYRSVGGNRLFMCCDSGPLQICKDGAKQDVPRPESDAKPQGCFIGGCLHAVGVNKLGACRSNKTIFLVCLFGIVDIVTHTILAWFITDPSCVRTRVKTKGRPIVLPGCCVQPSTHVLVEGSLALGTWAFLNLSDLMLNLVIMVLLCRIQKWIAVARRHLRPYGHRLGTIELSRNVTSASVTSLTIVNGTSDDLSSRSAVNYPDYDRAIKTTGLFIGKIILTVLPIVIVELLSIFQWFPIPAMIQHASVDLVLLGGLLDPILFFYGLRSVRFSCAHFWCRGALENARNPKQVKQPEPNETLPYVTRKDTEVAPV
ncbi:hypothetical protein D915_006037 [Fasciola hepatica]|uniref:Uncharacterized protein n=1 Tax=Fasciola hepatica TaxID=6192 RepID=A0A4E0R4L2_FASHE|nr:hypothetical protein D915_006037 [Fasciola hepatica]